MVKLKYNLFSKTAKKKYARKSIKRSIVKFSNVNSLVTNYYDQSTFFVDTSTTALQLAFGISFNCDASTSSGSGAFLCAPTNQAELETLYDCYKINKIVFMLIPTYNINAISLGQNTKDNMPGIHSVIDYNDSSTPASINELVEYKSYKYTRGGQIHKRVFTPKVGISTNTNTGINNSMQSIKPVWVNFGTERTLHFGIKLMTDPVAQITGQDAPVITWNVRVKFYLQLKNNK